MKKYLNNIHDSRSSNPNEKSALFTLYYGVQSFEYHIMMSIYMMNGKIRKITNVWNDVKNTLWTDMLKNIITLNFPVLWPLLRYTRSFSSDNYFIKSVFDQNFLTAQQRFHSSS
jgi:hypothetical protein